MTTQRSEYIGFTVNETSRVYTMRVRNPDGEFHDFQFVIAIRCFLSKQVRYQDAPEICFLKLQQELSACDENSVPSSRIQITDADLEAYRQAHAKKTPSTRPRFTSSS